jgi:hypothetical protein
LVIDSADAFAFANDTALRAIGRDRFGQLAVRGLGLAAVSSATASAAFTTTPVVAASPENAWLNSPAPNQ